MDQHLKEIESLILQMEGLERQIVQCKEQQKWVDDVIAQKQKIFEESKLQHEERIRTITRQSRKHRGKSKKQGMPGDSFDMSDLACHPGSPQQDDDSTITP